MNTHAYKSGQLARQWMRHTGSEHDAEFFLLVDMNNFGCDSSLFERTLTTDEARALHAAVYECALSGVLPDDVYGDAIKSFIAGYTEGL